jgi:hypothetical protein
MDIPKFPQFIATHPDTCARTGKPIKAGDLLAYEKGVGIVLVDRAPPATLVATFNGVCALTGRTICKGDPVRYVKGIGIALASE